MTTAIKERPILFSGEMVKAILAGRKTMTRRIVKHDPALKHYRRFEHIDGSVGAMFGLVPQVIHGSTVQTVWCPYGQPSDHLWVREAFGDRADYASIGKLRADRFYYAADGKIGGWKYKPSIHMPRWASRITLEITGVRVEKLSAITEADAIAEGCERIERGPFQVAGIPVHPMTSTYVESFRELWESINGPGSWAASPWVWVVSFKRVESEMEQR